MNQSGGDDFTTIDEYIALFPQDVQDKLLAIRQVIQDAAPDAEEKISYRLPTFYLQGNLVHFAAFVNHIGLYPTPTGMDKFRERLSGYESGKGSVQFPLNLPIPLDLVREIVEFRVQENLARAAAKCKKK